MVGVNESKVSNIDYTIKGRIINPCFPRSGHRFLKNLLKYYFERKLIYCAAKNVHLFRHENYVKNHDFYLRGKGVDELIFNTSLKYIVQYRHPLYSLVSLFEHGVRQNNFECLPENWKKMREKNLVYWKKLMDKWFFSTKGKSNVIYVSYEDLCNDTEKELEKIICFMTGREVVDKKKIKEAVNIYSKKLLAM